MREYWILTKLQLTSLFGINKMLHTRRTEVKKQGKKNLWALIAMAVVFLCISIQYSLLLGDALSRIGQLPQLLGLMVTATSALLLVFSVFEAKGVLFRFGDYDIVMSWPVRISAVAASRVTAMYAYNLIYGLLLLLPAGVIYGMFAKAAWWFYPLYLILALFVPALPTVVGAALGTLATLATAGMKKKNLFGAAFQIVFVVCIMASSMGLNQSMDHLSENPQALAGAAGAYPPAQWMMEAVTKQAPGLGYGLLLVAVPLAALGLFAYLLGKCFVSVNSRLAATPKAKAYRMGKLERTGRVRALYRLEWKRYINSILYLTNTIFGYVLLLAAAVVLGVVQPKGVMEALQAPELSWLVMALPLLFGWITMMSGTTASAISMEGKHLWIVKSMPVPARDWLMAKLMVSLTPALPAVFVGTLTLGIGLELPLIQWVWLFVVPLCYALFTGVFGLWINLRMPKLDWKTEAEVVKQSAPVMFQVMGGMFIMIASVVVLVATQSAWVMPMAALLPLVVALLLWKSLMRTAEHRLYQL